MSSCFKFEFSGKKITDKFEYTGKLGWIQMRKNTVKSIPSFKLTIGDKVLTENDLTPNEFQPPSIIEFQPTDDHISFSKGDIFEFEQEEECVNAITMWLTEQTV